MRSIAFVIVALCLLMTPVAYGQQEKETVGTFPGVGRMEDWKASLPEYRAGLNCMRQKKWDDAIGHFRASLALYKYQSRAYLQIGKAIEAKDGAISEAEQAYKDATALDSSNWRAWKRLANVLYQQKKMVAAREAAAAAVALNPPQKERAEVDSLIRRIDAANTSAGIEEN